MLQLADDQVKIPFVPSEYIRHILKDKNPRLQALDRIYEYRESIPCVLHPLLIAETAKRLAWRPADDDVYVFSLRIVESYG